MTLTGNMLIGQQAITGNREAIRAINPATDQPLDLLSLATVALWNALFLKLGWHALLRS